MSWSIEERIGECRPFPAQVVVYRGETDECMAYVSGEVADRLKAENAGLRELVKDMWPFVKEGSVHPCPNRGCCLFEECDAYSGRECPISEHMAVRMRDLGIEVN